MVTLFTTLISVSTTLVAQVGLIPVLRVLRVLSRTLAGLSTSRSSARIIQTLLDNPSLNGRVVTTLIEAITPLLKDCLKFPTYLYYIYIELDLSSMTSNSAAKQPY